GQPGLSERRRPDARSPAGLGRKQRPYSPKRGTGGTIMPALETMPRLPVALLPTPLHPLESLQAALGPNAPRLLIKRDDMTGLALGGNKARKLDYLFADARAQGADTLITCGAAQSNHALQTAAAARRFGFAVRCVLYGSERGPEAHRTGNVLLHSLL